MLSIQDVGQEIMLDSPRKFYVFLGEEYGVKYKYIQKLYQHYHNIKSCETVSEVLSFMSTKHLFKPEPCVYVVRYDESFIKELDDTIQSRIESCNIIGTIVCLYENKQDKKFDKYLPNYSVYIPKVDRKFINKYLKSDFPNLPDELIHIASNIGRDYMQSRMIAECMSVCPLKDILNYNQSEFRQLFGVSETSDDRNVRLGTASRNFKYILDVTEKYIDNPDRLLYTMLSTMIELEKITYNKYVESDIREYLRLWSLEDIYNMYNHIYHEIQQVRTVNKSAEDSACYLAALMQFKSIPELIA